jgi:stearoyl-CoA desaturase (delta-9 desaturase)
MHVLAAFAFFPKYFTWTGLAICLFLFWFSIWIGIGVCFHRLLTHGSFKTSKWFRYVLTIAGTLSWEGGPIVWVGRHRVHHRYADTEKDPHTPKHGFDWAHMLWTMFRTTKEQNKDVWEITKDLQKDAGLVWINKFFWISQVILAVLLYSIGSLQSHDRAMSWLVWGIGVRTMIGYHITWAVNSFTHAYGYRNFNTNDLSTNNMIVGFLSGGEGWHNNHHHYPASAEHGGQRWFELDPTYWTIRLFEKCGLAWDVISFRKQ